ncbi:hypothetical protein [Mycolicibacterium celeriflavum]|uniref:Uncharacterized protein n=1 Tax=Mycolicibacterium celeriflavum TaxID=1249101 RepID=A0A7I7RFD4_MYCCF|nr:hypothetical protein [Mycolicibacterium celeriflavum]MCV7239546.1 hypothetical protein [Mycolicibacterium celeriflavum]BBY43237.1 hypothetical protein MCEL_15320 [Mycolicibacterium celeriflavum]
MNIRTGIVGDNPVLVDIFERIAGPDQAEVDLHLEGPGVENHATNAKYFAQFVSGISDAVKETAKARAGKGRYSEHLLIEGVGPGSVRVVLRAPTPTVPEGDRPIDEISASSVDSDALRSIVAILTHASSDDDESPLVAELLDLPPQARRGLKRATKTTNEAGWNIRGSIRQRNVGAEDVALTPQGAFRLRQGLDAQVESRTEETMAGNIDGFRRSLSTLYFQPENSARIIQAAVFDPEIAAAITDLFSEPDLMVEVVFEVIESYLPGDKTHPRRSRSVQSIRRIGVGRQLTIGADETSRSGR